MTNVDFKKVFGDKILHLKPIEIKPIDVNFEFDNITVFVPDDFTNVVVVKCKIHEAKIVDCHGVIPVDQPSDGIPRFNCCIGDYKEFRCEVHVDLNDFKGDDKFCIISSLGVRSIGYTTKPNIYQKSIAEKNIDKLFPISHNQGWCGFFISRSKAFEAISKKHLNYIQELQSAIDNALTIENIKKKLTIR